MSVINKIFFAICTFLMVVSISFAQNSVEFGSLSNVDLNFNSYEKDSLADAVYLYEYGDNYFEVRDNRIWLITKYHAKIKVLTLEGIDQSIIEVPYYHTDKSTEKINDLKALTHNSGISMGVKKSEIFDIDVSENWSEKRFTFPNVKVGSILEYTYEIQSPFHFNLKGWDFQSDIPKIYSEYNARIPGNWVYNRALIGERKLDFNEAKVKKYCFSIPGGTNEASCEVLKYIMKDIPAYEESEEFMLSSNNYKSRLEFELSEYKMFRGGTEKFTKTWKDVDTEFKTDKDIGSQLRKRNFFEKNVDPTLFTVGEPLDRAKKIYSFVQNHFTWNEKYGIWHNNRVKDAFEEKSGNVAEINIALINLLNARGFNANIMLMATRKRGLPKKTHPVMTDFNYILAKVDIDGVTYLLDATERNLPFGMLPYRCLNYYGRVMDFDKESYWYDIIPEGRNNQSVRMQIKLNPKERKMEGILDLINAGYQSVSRRDLLESMSREKYLEEFEKTIGNEFYVNSYAIKDEYSGEKKLVERFEFDVEEGFQASNIYLNPFLFKFFDKNPFLSTRRSYPIDFGFIRNYEYFLNVEVPKGYRLKELPKSKNIALPDNLGAIKFNINENASGTINMVFSFALNSTHFDSQNFEMIRDFFSEGVDIQTHSLIVLEKI